MKKILVLLSTYNGEKYLRKLLDSVYLQINVDIHILARDDGSTDNTINILTKYQKSNGCMTIIQGENIGAKLSFYTLMNYACSNFNNFDYYAFADQDDVWLENKLFCAIKKLENINNSQYTLYGSGFTIVDNQLNKIKQISLKKYFSYKTCLFRNPILGCTMVMNYGLLSKSNDCIKLILKDIKKHYLFFHDAFVFIVANFFGANIVMDDASFILYRSHDDNVSVSSKSNLRRAFSFIIRKLSITNTLEYHSQLILKFYKRHNDEKEHFLNICSNYSKSLSNSIKLLRSVDFKGENFIKRVIYIILILLRKL